VVGVERVALLRLGGLPHHLGGRGWEGGAGLKQGLRAAAVADCMKRRPRLAAAQAA
jgi:hypothetical protein